MKNARITEIVNSFHSFSKERYHNTEILPELLALQGELVEILFSDEDVNKSNLRIWDVEKRLEEMNAECNGIVTKELRSFKQECKHVSNLIKAEISGRRGEEKAFESLSAIRGDHVILKNIELFDGTVRSELDAVVITRNGAFIVEVKNSRKNIFIDVEGNYYKTGEYLKWDSNLGDKMRARKELLSAVLSAQGLSYMPIYKIIVFTNNRIEVQNKCADLKTCFLSQLPYVIDNYHDTMLSFKEMDLATEAITAANNESIHTYEFDAERFKHDFANIIATLELAKTKKHSNWLEALKVFFSKKVV